MDFDSYKLEDLFVTAIKSETESKKIYSDLADTVKNAFLKEKLKFLSQEEEKHRAYLENEFRKQFPDLELVIPEHSPVPLPEILVADENVPLSEIIQSAMKAELAAHDFYSFMAGLFDKDIEVKRTLHYFADMEMSHYHLLDIEKENLLKFEDYDTYWEMMNIGP